MKYLVLLLLLASCGNRNEVYCRKIYTGNDATYTVCQTDELICFLHKNKNPDCKERKKNGIR